ncbi:MAG: glycosyltransferase [Gammaproteobacteria bacterium]|nr:glycosyltransferase [Gammaproteobacteria bacterium]
MGHGVIIEVIYAPVVGGSEMLAFNLCRDWQRSGIKARICCLYKREGALIAAFEAAGIPYDLLDVGALPVWRRWIRVWRYLRRAHPAAIHVHHLSSLVNVLLPAYLAGCFRIVYTEHSSWGIAKTTWMRLALPVISMFVRRFTCVSRDLADVFRALGVPRRIVTIYNGVDVQRYHPNPSRPEVSPVVRIGAVGRLVEEKDYPTLLKAFALLKDRVRFFAEIAGDGPLAGDLRMQARALGLADIVRFRGRCDNVPAFLRDLDIYVLSSQHEGLPIAIMEAMATALPVVATRITAIPEIIEDGVTGVLVEPGDPPAMAEALASLARDAGRRRDLGAEAMRRVRATYTIQHTSRSYARYLGVEGKDKAAS